MPEYRGAGAGSPFLFVNEFWLYSTKCLVSPIDYIAITLYNGYRIRKYETKQQTPAQAEMERRHLPETPEGP